MNLSSLATELNMSVQELRAKARANGFGISSRANKIDNQLAKRILDALAPQRTPQAPTGPTVRKTVKLPPFIKVRDFGTVLNLPIAQVIKALISNGVMATINEEVDFDTASIVAQDLGFDVETEADQSQKEFGLGFLQEVLKSEQEDSLKPRAPIVAIMGHVDHGKTTLLDAIRKTKVAEGESGGITQHIGAYQVRHGGKPITFLDTPGHEAFSEMRARGANVTDIIVLVVAADDGVRPQTLEVINRAKFTNTPLLVAINKIDKPGANVVKVKQELAGHGVLTEEWGGKTIAVEISAKTNEGLDKLLEMILLLAEVENFRANPHGRCVATIIESRIAHGQGSTATCLVQNGTLKVGDLVVAGAASGRVRSLEDESGKKLKEAGPSAPVQIAGFSEVPQAGDILQVVPSLDEARRIALAAQRKARSRGLAAKQQLQGDVATKSLNLVLKADVAGSLEAIKQSLQKLKNDEVKLSIVGDGVGEVNESDILRAESAKAGVVAFRTKVNPKAAQLAKQKSVVVDEYDVIYELIEDITSAMVNLFTPEFEHISHGRAEILAIFRTEKGEMIVGGKVKSGEIKKSDQIAVYRGGAEVGRGEILDLQQSKVAAKIVNAGEEFGVKVKTQVKVQVGDELEGFEEKIKQKTL